MRRAALSLAMLALGAGLLASAAAHGGDARGSIREGGTFRVSWQANFFDHIDPAISYGPTWALVDTTCASLMRYPDKPPPAGFRLAPEVAAGFPRVSSDFKTFTFTLRTNFRFSDGAPVRASAFARAIERTLAPGMTSPGAQYTQDIVGAKEFQAGRTTSVAGVVARGNRLVIRFTRPVPDFAARTTMPFFCAVPPTLPADPEGVGAFPAAGPYYVAEYRPGQRVVIERNRFYRGSRPHHVDRFLVDLTANSSQEVLDGIERGTTDWGLVPPTVLADATQRLLTKYGRNKTQFFIGPGLFFRGYALNTSRPLFRDNAKLRRAVNFAIDRAALQRASGGPLTSRLTDQYLPPTMPGFKDARIYPLRGPDLRRARALARGNTRSGKAVLYTIDLPLPLRFAQIIKRNLAEIRLEVEVIGIPRSSYFSRRAARDAPYDIALFPWTADYIDPFSYINLQLDSRFIGAAIGAAPARFRSRKYDRLMRRAARLQGAARTRAYGDLDIQLARDAAPLVAVEYVNDVTLVSNRVGCVVLRQWLNLTAACLKR
jgi:peptide/nickel transport system substrate-binding protein